MAESLLSFTLEGDFGVPCTLVAPDGTTYATNSLGLPIKGRLIYDHAEVNENGETVVIHSPCLTLRASTLPRIPRADEPWAFKVPLNMANQAITTTFVLDPDRPPKDGMSIGFIRFYLMAAIQVNQGPQLVATS